MIRRLVEDAALPTGSGLRIARHEEKPWLTMCLAAEAGPDDAVLVEHEATVFLAPIAGDRLADQLLDARTGETGTAFYLRP